MERSLVVEVSEDLAGGLSNMLLRVLKFRSKQGWVRRDGYQKASGPSFGSSRRAGKTDLRSSSGFSSAPFPLIIFPTFSTHPRRTFHSASFPLPSHAVQTFFAFWATSAPLALPNTSPSVSTASSL